MKPRHYSPRKVITQANYVDHYSWPDSFGENVILVGIGEVNTMPSVTVPDQQLSLADMIKRYVRGQDVQVFQPSYLGDDDLFPDNFEAMSEMDRKDAARELKAAIHQERTKPRPQRPAPAPAPVPGELPGSTPAPSPESK